MNESTREDLITKGRTLLDGIGRNSNLSGRQKAGAMLDAGADMARLGIDPDISDRLSGMKGSIGPNRLARTQAAAFGQQVTAADGRQASTAPLEESPLSSLPATAGAATNQRPEIQVGGRVAAAIAAPPTLGGAPFARSEPAGVLTNPAASNMSRTIAETGITQPGTSKAPAPGIVGGPLSDSARAGGFRPELAGLTVQPGQSGGAFTFNSGPRAGQTLGIDQPRYSAPDGSLTTQHRGSQENLQGIADAEGIKRQLANIQRMRLETDAFDPTITDPTVRESARQQLGYMAAQAGQEGEAYGRSLDNQAKSMRLANEGQMAGLQAQYLAESDPARREAIAEKIRGVTGKSTAPTPANLQHVETDKGTMVFDPRTGRMMPAVGPDGQPVGSGKPLNEYQGKSTGFGIRAAESSRIIEEVGQGGKVQPSLIKRAAESVPLVGEGLGMAANRFASPEQQQVEQAERDFINAVLRQESGAAIADTEFANARKQYFPQPGDSAEVIEQKRANREAAINGFRISAGTGARNIGNAPAQAAKPAAGPAAGAVEDGYVFLGGNPNDPNNWAEVRK